MENEYVGIGYSNSKEYQLLAIEGNNGLVELPEWLYPVWCIFERIEVINNKKNIKQCGK